MSHGLTLPGWLFLAENSQNGAAGSPGQDPGISAGRWSLYHPKTVFANHCHCLEKMLYVFKLGFEDLSEQTLVHRCGP